MRNAMTAGSILVAALATDAAAQCSQSSLRGFYVYFAIDAAKAAGRGRILGSFVERCVLQIDGTGAIVGTAPPACQAEFLDERFLIDSQCAIELSTSICDYSGQLSPDRLLMAGTAFCPNVDFGLETLIDLDVYFNFVRARRDVFESAEAQSESALGARSLFELRKAPSQATEPDSTTNASGR